MACSSSALMTTFFKQTWPYYEQSSPHPKVGGFLIGYGKHTSEADARSQSQEQALVYLEQSYEQFKNDLGLLKSDLLEEQLVVLFSLKCYLQNSFYQHSLWYDLRTRVLTPGKLSSYLRSPKLKEHRRLYSPVWARVRQSEQNLLKANDRII